MILEWMFNVMEKITIRRKNLKSAIKDGGGACFKYEGSKVFVLEDKSTTVHEYNLTSPYSVESGVSFSVNSFVLGSEEALARGITLESFN